MNVDIHEQILAHVAITNHDPVNNIVAIENIDEVITMRRAVSHGDIDTVKSLLDGGADIEAIDEDGRSALMLAAYHGNYEIMELLLDRGADVNAKDHFGWSALMEAAFYNDSTAMDFLLDNGAEFDSKDSEVLTGISLVVADGNTELATLLLNDGNYRIKGG